MVDTVESDCHPQAAIAESGNMNYARKTKMKNKRAVVKTKGKPKVLVSFIQDRSGSMQHVWEETLSGFQSYIRNLKSDPEGDYLFSLTTFDTVADQPYVAERLASVDEDILTAYGPRGSTALYDALGATIRETEKSESLVSKILVVIVTDGYENSSREWSKEKIRSLVNEKSQKANWTFVYLGTQPETWEDAGAINMSMGNTMSYNPRSSKAAYSAMAGATRSWRSSPQEKTANFSMDYLSEEQAAAADIQRKPEKEHRWSR